MNSKELKEWVARHTYAVGVREEVRQVVEAKELEKLFEGEMLVHDYIALAAAAILDDYAHLQETGEIEAAGRYAPANVRKIAEMLQAHQEASDEV